MQTTRSLHDPRGGSAGNPARGTAERGAGAPFAGMRPRSRPRGAELSVPHARLRGAAAPGGRKLGAEWPRSDPGWRSRMRPSAPLPAPLFERPSPGRIPASGRVAGRSRFHRGACDGCDPGDAHGPAPRASAGSTVASPQVGALQGGAGSVAVCAMDATPETREGRHHAPWPAPLSHPHKWAPALSCAGPCSTFRRARVAQRNTLYRTSAYRLTRHAGDCLHTGASS